MRDLSLESLFGDGDLDVDCPACEKTFQIKFKEVMTSGSTVTCPSCNQDIVINHDETTEKTMKDGNKALKEFEKALKKFK